MPAPNHQIEEYVPLLNNLFITEKARPENKIFEDSVKFTFLFGVYLGNLKRVEDPNIMENIIWGNKRKEGNQLVRFFPSFSRSYCFRSFEDIYGRL